MNTLADALNELQEEIDRFSIAQLVDNEVFVSFVMHISQVAIKNHQEEKLRFLRDAVLNVAMNPPGEHLESLLIGFLDVATPWHIRVLEFYSNPEPALEEANLKPETGDYLSNVVSKVFPELEDKDAFRLQIERDLLHYGLVLPESVWCTQRMTNSGDKLLEYLKNPIDKET